MRITRNDHAEVFYEIRRKRMQTWTFPFLQKKKEKGGQAGSEACQELQLVRGQGMRQTDSLIRFINELNVRYEAGSGHFFLIPLQFLI